MSEARGGAPQRDAQLTLRLFPPPALDFESYFPGANVEAVDALKAWSDGSGAPVVWLWGAPASGRTHLAQAAVRACSEGGARAIYVGVAELLGNGPGILDGLEALDAVALDDVDACRARHAWEACLFRLYNDLQARGGRLLMTAARAPAGRPFELGDLASRAQASLVYQLREPDDAGKAEALRLGAARRGLTLPEPVLEFVLRRARRDMRALSAVLDRLDSASLAQGRALTVPFAREVLDVPAEP